MWDFLIITYILIYTIFVPYWLFLCEVFWLLKSGYALCVFHLTGILKIVCATTNYNFFSFLGFLLLLFLLNFFLATYAIKKFNLKHLTVQVDGASLESILVGHVLAIKTFYRAAWLTQTIWYIF